MSTVRTSQDDRYRVGSLVYTKRGLLVLFFWLLWGDFIFIIMESVGRILPVMLKRLNASDWMIGLVLVSLPRLIEFVVNPIVSYASDRTRTRWGRRRPYLLAATPVVFLTLVMVGYSSEITAWIGRLLGQQEPSSSLAITVLAILLSMFSIANSFITSTYYYVFNDVVPAAFLSRFMSWARVVGALAGAIYSYFIFGLSETYSKEIFAYIALAYLIIFGLQCIFIKESDYPPPPENVDGKTGLFSGVKTFFVECFSLRYYWYFFLANTFWAVGFFGMGAYMIFYARTLGVSLDALGKATAVFGLISAALGIPAGILADRKHPLFVNVVGAAILVLLLPFNLVFLVPGFPMQWAPTVFYVLLGAATVTGTLYYASEMPMYMRILPKDRFGQFCSANAMLRAVAMIVAGSLGGAFLSFTKRFEKVEGEHYLWMPLWSLFFSSFALLFLVLLRRDWKKLGGMDNYVAPIKSRAPATAEVPVAVEA